jgi:4-amino-4-deoxy-L-arabinose transferase-like glycosyltransferase
VPAVRKAVVMLDAGFEVILGTVLVMGVVYADIDNRDFPAPASDLVIALFGLALFIVALVLATLVKNETLGDGVLAVLAASNAATALVLLIWVLAADGFSPQGRAVTWVTIGALLALSSAQALARNRR